MDEETVKGKTFAPRDVKLVVYDSKDDRQGLGFVKGRGMARLPGRAGPGQLPLSNWGGVDSQLSAPVMWMTTMTIRMPMPDLLIITWRSSWGTITTM